MLHKALKIDGTLKRLRQLPRSMCFDSTCTGTGSFELAALAVGDALNSLVISEGDEQFDATHLSIYFVPSLYHQFSVSRHLHQT